MKFRLRIAVLLLFCSNFSGQASTAKFYSVNALFGISMREVNSVCEDNYGFVWASSKTGILRLSKDNYHIYRLPYESADVIRVRLLYKNFKLFAYTNNGQVFFFDPVFDRFELISVSYTHLTLPTNREV